MIKLSVQAANTAHGGLSNPSKMPGKATGLPAAACPTGSRLAAAGIDGPCTDCYAKKGRYGFQNVQDAQARRLAALSNPDWTPAMVSSISRMREPWFRWHDSGDVQDRPHAERILDVVEATPTVDHWLPTQEWGIMRKLAERIRALPNLVVRFSARAYGDAPRMRVWGHWSSVVAADVWRAMRTNPEAHVAAGVTPYACPAKDQENECKDCRACWSRDVAWVVYPKH